MAGVKHLSIFLVAALLAASTVMMRPAMAAVETRAPSQVIADEPTVVLLAVSLLELDGAVGQFRIDEVVAGQWPTDTVHLPVEPDTIEWLSNNRQYLIAVSRFRKVRAPATKVTKEVEPYIVRLSIAGEGIMIDSLTARNVLSGSALRDSDDLAAYARSLVHHLAKTDDPYLQRVLSAEIYGHRPVRGHAASNHGKALYQFVLDSSRDTIARRMALKSADGPVPEQWGVDAAIDTLRATTLPLGAQSGQASLVMGCVELISRAEDGVGLEELMRWMASEHRGIAERAARAVYARDAQKAVERARSIAANPEVAPQTVAALQLYLH